VCEFRYVRECEGEGGEICGDCRTVSLTPHPHGAKVVVMTTPESAKESPLKNPVLQEIVEEADAETALRGMQRELYCFQHALRQGESPGKKKEIVPHHLCEHLDTLMPSNSSTNLPEGQSLEDHITHLTTVKNGLEAVRQYISALLQVSERRKLLTGFKDEKHLKRFSANHSRPSTKDEQLLKRAHEEKRAYQHGVTPWRTMQGEEYKLKGQAVLAVGRCYGAICEKISGMERTIHQHQSVLDGRNEQAIDLDEVDTLVGGDERSEKRREE